MPAWYVPPKPSAPAFERKQHHINERERDRFDYYRDKYANVPRGSRPWELPGAAEDDNAFWNRAAWDAYREENPELY
jgi:hypothetical protein